MRALVALFASLVPVVVAVACGGGKSQPQTATWTPDSASTAAPSATQPACSDAPANPAEVMAKEPAVLSTCLASAGKVDTNLCGKAQIAVEVNKDGRVVRAEVASSTLPTAVTDCMKARLSSIQYACPKEGSATYTVPVGIPIGNDPTGACPGLPPPGSMPGTHP